MYKIIKQCLYPPLLKKKFSVYVKLDKFKQLQGYENLGKCQNFKKKIIVVSALRSARRRGPAQIFVIVKVLVDVIILWQLAEIS